MINFKTGTDTRKLYVTSDSTQSETLEIKFESSQGNVWRQNLDKACKRSKEPQSLEDLWFSIMMLLTW